MKLALLAPFPLRSHFSDRLTFKSNVFVEHPASWVVNLVELLRSSDIEVSLISLNSQLSSDYDFVEGNCHYYFLRGSPFRLQALSLFQYDRMRLLKTLEKKASKRAPHIKTSIVIVRICLLKGIRVEFMLYFPCINPVNYFFVRTIRLLLK